MFKQKLQKILIILILGLSHFSIFAQLSLVSEKVNGNQHILFYKNDFTFHTSIISGQNKLQFDYPTDESKPNEFILPIATLFIPIQANTNPQVQFVIDAEDIIAATPEINPTVTFDNQKLIHYEYNTSLPKSYNSKFLIVKGKLTNDGKNYLHLSIFPFLIDPNKRNIQRVVKFHLEIIYPNNIVATFSPQNNRNSISESKIIFNDYKLAKYNLVGNDTTDDWIDFNANYIKIGVNKDAVYRLTYNDLSSFFNFFSVNPKSFKLLCKGNEIPIFVSGEEDNTFDPNDFIEFVGVKNMGGNHRTINKFGDPYTEYLNRYTDTTIYWLTWGGQNGIRVKTLSNENSFSISDTVKYYHEIIHYEKNNWFDFSMADQVRREMPYWYENKTWVDNQLGVGTRNYTFTISNLYSGGKLRLFSRLQDYASNISQRTHLLAISVNNAGLQDSGYINKYEQKILTGNYPGSVLTNGNNTLKIYSFTTDASLNACAFDWYEVEYPRYLNTYNDSLLFTFPFLDSLPTLKGVKITNVSSDSIVVWKYGKTIKKYQLFRNSNNEIVFFDTLTNQDRFVLIKESKVSKPMLYYAKKFVNLRNSQNQADYLAITHKNFLAKSKDYAAFISNSYNVTTKVIDVEDIYDEFAYGYFNPEAIKDFLITTHNNWQTPAPKYVCLIGGATYDYHGNKTKFMNTPPKYNFVPSFGASVSDNWFVSWDTTGAYIPQMHIGRIPVTNNEEFDNYFTKHKNYVSRQTDSWNKRFIFFSGGTGDNQAQLDQLREVNNYVINNFVEPKPIGGMFKHFFKTITPKTNFGPVTDAEFQKAIDDGSIIISYLGHSGTQTWDNSITNSFQLKSKNVGNPLITDFGCSTARFAEPDITSFSQLFVVSKDGDAIAYIGNSSFGFLSTSLLGPKLFYEQILKDSIYTISEALENAKIKMLQNYGSSSVYKLFTLTNTLIGDPIIRLPIPQKPNLALSTTDFKVQTGNISDNMDSVYLTCNYFNFGKATSDTFRIEITDVVKDTTNSSYSIKRTVPLFSDSLTIAIPIKKKVGEHTLSLNLDSNSEIDELSKADNTASIKYFVFGSSIRTNLPTQIANGIGEFITLFNPISRPSSDSVQVEIAQNPNFDNSTIFKRKSDTISTTISFQDLSFGSRYWMRAKTVNDEQYGSFFSFIKQNKKTFLLNDSISFATSSLANLVLSNGLLEFDSTRNTISTFSAGFGDGNSALIQLNKKNYIPENTLRGHHVCLFNDSTFEFISYRRFDVFGGGTTEVNNYINFLNTLPNNYIIAIAVSDEGTVSSPTLRAQIKTLGSIFIDSLSFHGSWTIIGKKGAIPGSIPEAFSRTTLGSVSVDTTFVRRNTTGSITTSTIGLSGRWDSLFVSYNKSDGITASFSPIGVKLDGTVDTLSELSFNNNFADLSNLDAHQYPQLKIVGNFRSISDTTQINLSSLSVKFSSPAELTTNYQVVSVSRDTVIQGDSLDLHFYVYNVGESPADSFHVLVEVMKEDNSSRLLLDTVVASLDSMQRKMFTLNYMTNATDGKGNMGFKIKIDPDNHVREFYEDNNEFTISFYTKPDTNVVSVSASSVSVTFDNAEILNGDFVSSNPNIKVDLKYPTWFAVSDTASLSILLDNQRIPFDQLNIKNDSANRTLTFEFIPVLSSGEHQFTIFGNNVYGKLDKQPGFERVFTVSNELAILNCYTYPNPAKENTYFTFKLPKLPEELTIRVYTIAGRLIKEIKKSAAELHLDFNRIFWDTKDEDGNALANGVYLYKVIAKQNGKSESITQKLAIVK